MAAPFDTGDAAGAMANNVTLQPRELHMEVFDPRTGDVWLQQAPLTEAEYRAYRPEPPYMKSGFARSAMDYASFRRSPGASADDPLEERVIGGRTLVRVAKPLAFRGLARGDAPTRLQVVKHHEIGFAPGTRVRLARLPDGAWFVQQTVAPGHERVPVPADWQMFEVRPRSPWSIHLAAPVTVYFFRNLASFQGPVPREQIPVEPEAEENPTGS